jgi:formate hydrogenlyase subunit 3/multisubunit Na+/H+ antiporter MnhD subunit
VVDQVVADQAPNHLGRRHVLPSAQFFEGLLLGRIDQHRQACRLEVGDLDWAYPVGTLRLRLDALGAFFLAWSLPMTLLGSVYAAGYLRPFFGTRATWACTTRCST